MPCAASLSLSFESDSVSLELLARNPVEAVIAASIPAGMNVLSASSPDLVDKVRHIEGGELDLLQLDKRKENALARIAETDSENERKVNLKRRQISKLRIILMKLLWGHPGRTPSFSPFEKTNVLFFHFCALLGGC